MANTDTTRLNPPRQSRSRRTLERIVGAALEILEGEGPEALTVQAIVDRAGSSVGSFYARFSGKDDLINYLGERVWREAASRWDAALAEQDWTDLSLEEALGSVVTLLSRVGRSRASYLKALDRTPGAADDAYLAFHTHVIRGLEALLLERAGEIAHPEPAVAVPLALRAALAVLDAPTGTPTDGPDLDRRVREAQLLVKAYLVAGAPEADGPPGQVDFFDVWG